VNGCGRGGERQPRRRAHSQRTAPQRCTTATGGATGKSPTTSSSPLSGHAGRGTQRRSRPPPRARGRHATVRRHAASRRRGRHRWPLGRRVAASAVGACQEGSEPHPPPTGHVGLGHRPWVSRQSCSGRRHTSGLPRVGSGWRLPVCCNSKRRLNRSPLVAPCENAAEDQFSWQVRGRR